MQGARTNCAGATGHGRVRWGPVTVPARGGGHDDAASARESGGDKRRSYGIVSGEACEACAAVEIAGAIGACSPADVQAVLALVRRIRRVFFPLVR
jgi:hypothetical protein